jgi:hypothetical protein
VQLSAFLVRKRAMGLLYILKMHWRSRAYDTIGEEVKTDAFGAERKAMETWRLRKSFDSRPKEVSGNGSPHVATFNLPNTAAMLGLMLR